MSEPTMKAMRIEDNFCSGKQAKQLCELGVPQVGRYTWEHRPINDFWGLHNARVEPMKLLWKCRVKPKVKDGKLSGEEPIPEYYSAFNVAELFEMHSWDYVATFRAYDLWFWVDLRNEDPGLVAGAGRHHSLRKGWPTEAQARADFIIRKIFNVPEEQEPPNNGKCLPCEVKAIKFKPEI